jgi:hypothetical protein
VFGLGIMVFVNFSSTMEGFTADATFCFGLALTIVSLIGYWTSFFDYIQK